jgi:hypothetical protein
LNTNKTTEQTTRRGGQVTALEVPEFPALAPGVELTCEMEEKGFKERQWLVRRNDRFVQLSEPLYPIAEQVDGKSTHVKIAEETTRSTVWLVSVENVRQLPQSKLLP